MGILGVAVFIRLGVRYANRLGRLLFSSVLNLGRLGGVALPTYRVYQKMHDAWGVGCAYGHLWCGQRRRR